MNPITADRLAFAKALAAIDGLSVRADQPEVFEADTILFDSYEIEPGDTFGQITALYTLHVVVSAFDAEHAAAQLDSALYKVLEAARDCADFTSSSAAFNLTDAANNIYPAITVRFTSHIDI